MPLHELKEHLSDSPSNEASLVGSRRCQHAARCCGFTSPTHQWNECPLCPHLEDEIVTEIRIQTTWVCAYSLPGRLCLFFISKKESVDNSNISITFMYYFQQCEQLHTEEAENNIYIFIYVYKYVWYIQIFFVHFKTVKHRLQLTAFFVTHYFNIANKMMKETWRCT